ncbi:hypothetical protein KKF84_04855 [Myxococcota bacterium]|nr:hypothetical protein [Myxococcota bacterium]MBU1534625.1 hypothetical protein [Myxococcota bacterium]
MMKKIIFNFLLLTLIGSITGVSLAQAKKKVVLLPFNTKANKAGGKKVRNFIKTLLKGNYDYITKKSMKQDEGKIDFKNLSTAQIKELCGKFGITVFVGGKAERKRRKYSYTVIVYNWKDGLPALEKEFTFNRRIPTQKQLEQIAMATLQSIESLKEYEAPKIEKVVEKDPAIKQPIEDEKPLEVIKTPIVDRKKKIVTDVEYKLPALRAGLAFGFFTRTLDFDPASEPYYKTAGPSFAPIFDVEVYPMMLAGKEGPLANIGIGLKTFYMPVFKTYAYDNKDEKINTFILDFALDIRYRHKLTSDIVIGGKLGYQSRAWTFDTNDVIDVPGVSYSMFELGAFARLNVVSKVLIEGSLSMLLPLDAGEIVSADYYGEASLFGLKFAGLVGYRVMPNVEITASFEFNRFSFSFNDAGTRNANGAVDQYMSFALGGRYIY